MPSPNITLRVGDVIDLRNAYVRRNKRGKGGLLAVIRDSEKKTNLAVIADEKYQDLLFGKVSCIYRISQVSRKVGNSWKYFTNVYVDYENAFGETPVFVAESQKIYAFTKDRSAVKSSAKWQRPEFKTEIEDAEEET